MEINNCQKKKDISVLGKNVFLNSKTLIKFGGCHFKPSPFLISHRHISQQCHHLSSKTVLLLVFFCKRKKKKKNRKVAIDLRSNKVILKF